MKLICYPVSGDPPLIIPAPRERAWMSETRNSFAYRCLPLDMANAHGWFVLNSAPFVAMWDGGDEIDAIKIETQSIENMMLLAASHFGHGVLTFQVNGLFRT